MKSLCMRCSKQKQGIHEIVIFGLPYFVCNSCATKISNLLSMHKSSSNDRYKIKLEFIIFHAVGFNDL